MPAPGGSADKLGNRYESLWVIDQLLAVVDGASRKLMVEPLDPDESKGIEFKVIKPDGGTEYWSVKRQTTKASGWTLALLCSKDERGRTILGDLLTHVEKDPSHVAVFASTLAAPDLQELHSNAKTLDMLRQRLQQSAKLNSSFLDYVVPLCAGDENRGRRFLERIRAHAADEGQLRDRLDFAIRKLFYDDRGGHLDVPALRACLAELGTENLHQWIDRQSVLVALKQHHVRLRDWVADSSVHERIDDICSSYTDPIQSQLINGQFLDLAEPHSILNANGLPVSPKLLIVGAGGSGKSSTIAHVIQTLRHARVPVLPLRFDQLPEAVYTTTELGRKALLPESPVLTLAGIAVGKPCVLIVDQLDAVSLASGRRVELWRLFEQLEREIDRCPGMSLIVGCREFDLEHDHRMRRMKAEGSGFTAINLKFLSSTQVDAALSNAGINSSAVPPSFKPLLEVPLHLSMYLSLESAHRTAVSNRDGLFAAFWTDGERRVDRRLGRKAQWTNVIDRLADWLSANQQLSAPIHLLDDVVTDAHAMASEHILVVSDGRYRFFHESFFDYAFARRFASRGSRLLDLLCSGEQHLFRRAQVRQVLAFLRTEDWPKYLQELRAVLLASSVRFHVKRVVFQWLSSIHDPQTQEWQLLQEVGVQLPDLRSHIRGVVAGHAGWFDVLTKTGFFDSALTSGDATREEEAVWLLQTHPVLESRSSAIASILTTHWQSSGRWKNYLRFLFRSGDVYHGPEMFQFFLSRIEDGTLDDIRPGFAVNDSWWTTLYSMSKKRPDLCCETIGKWFDRALNIWRTNQLGDSAQSKSDTLRAHFDRGVDGTHVIQNASKAYDSYAQQILPRIAAVVAETAKKKGNDRLEVDALWSFRSFGDKTYSTDDALLVALATSLEQLAKTKPEHLDGILDPYKDRPHDAIAYLVLRAWTAAPETYADVLARYLASDPRRLKVGYATTGGGSAAIYVSSQAVKAAAPNCTKENLDALQGAILSMTDEWEIQHPQTRGLKQFELLQAIPSDHLSPAARKRLSELSNKFPDVKIERPRAMEVRIVGSPIPEDAQSKMSDEQWLRAMERYAGVGRRHATIESSGGERHLADSLQLRTKADAARFAALAERMPDDLPAAYFDAITRGIADAVTVENGSLRLPLPLPSLVTLLQRIDRLPKRPCGQAIGWLLRKASTAEWPGEVVHILAWYAINDPDPDKEAWKELTAGGQTYYNGDPHSAGVNSTRGFAADTIARMLFDSPERFGQLRDALQHAAHDKTVAVRACAIEGLIAALNVEPETAIQWFQECISGDDKLLQTDDAERFIHYAGHRNYRALEPAINKMLDMPEAVEAAARQVCLLSLNIAAAGPLADSVRAGSDAMRKAAAEVYAANVAQEVVGPDCRRLLKPMFRDPSDEVRIAAAGAFTHIGRLPTSDQADLLGSFLSSQPGAKELEPAIRALEDSHIQLPDLVCSLAEATVKAFRGTAGDISKADAMVGMDLSKIVVRLYAQTDDEKVKARCLDLVDDMERYHFMGLSEELQRLDR